jgi:hypothetical protein
MDGFTFPNAFSYKKYACRLKHWKTMAKNENIIKIE